MARERSRRVPAPRLKWCVVNAVKERSDLAGRLPRYLKTRELQVFLAVAESHSIAEAARRLSLTQPAVSKCINELENTLGVALFERDSRGISPTRYGEVLSRRAHSIFGEIRLAGEEISQLKGADSGKVSIGVMPVAAGGFAAAAVADLMTSHPGVCVSILEGDHEMLFEALRNRQIDLVVGRLPADLSASDLETELLYHDQLCVAAHPTHPLTQRKTIELEELADEYCVIPRLHSLAYQQLTRCFLHNRVRFPHKLVDTLSVQSVDALLATGKFIVLGLPCKVVDNRPGTGLVKLPISLDTDWGPVGISYLAGHELLPVASQLISFMKKHCASPAAI